MADNHYVPKFYLAEFVDPPYWNYRIDNCTPSEMENNNCIDLEGNPMPLEHWSDRDEWEAVNPIPKRLRPPSNFEWRSDSYTVNGGGGDRLNPGATSGALTGWAAISRGATTTA